MECDVADIGPVRVNVNSAGGFEVILAAGRDGRGRFRGPYGGWYAETERTVPSGAQSSAVCEADGTVEHRWTWLGTITTSGLVQAHRRDDRGRVAEFIIDLRDPDYTANTSL